MLTKYKRACENVRVTRSCHKNASDWQEYVRLIFAPKNAAANLGCRKQLHSKYLVGFIKTRRWIQVSSKSYVGKQKENEKVK